MFDRSYSEERNEIKICTVIEITVIGVYVKGKLKSRESPSPLMVFSVYSLCAQSWF